MKLKQKLCPLFLFCLFILFNSCKKEDSNTEPLINDVKCLLTNYSIIGSTYQEVLEYDEYKRLIKRGTSDDYYITFDYNTNGKIAEMIVYQNGEETNRTKYYWDTDKLTTISELRSKSNEWVYNAKYVCYFNQDKQITYMELYDYSDGDWMEDAHYVLEWENGNVIKKEYIDQDEKFILSEHFEYDDKEANNIVYDNYLNVFFDIQVLSKNNVTKEILRDSNGNISRTTTKTYEYNLDGYPIYFRRIVENQVTTFEQEFELNYNCD